MIWLAIFAWLALSAQGWTEGAVIGVPTDNAKRPILLFVRYDGAGTIPNMQISANQWTTIDLTNGPQWIVNNDAITFQPDLPEDTKAIFASGLLVISHPGGAIGTCDLWANFRAPSSNLPHDSYQIQTIEASTQKGVRSTASLIIPVKNRKFEVYWYFTPGCPSLINLSLQGYVR